MGPQRSHSINAVFPAFVKGMSNAGMLIGDGGEAMDVYHRMGELVEMPKESLILRKALLEYCGQDRLAMVKLLYVIKPKYN